MSRFPRWFQITWFVACHWLPRYLASWVVLLVVAGTMTYYGWDWFIGPRRDDGGGGHAIIDFGGQWYCGKMLLRGEGRFLYERHHIWIVLQESYPPDKNSATSIRVDRFRLEDWRTNADKDPEAAALLASYLLPLGARDGVGTASALVGGYDAAQPNREKFNERFGGYYWQLEAEGYVKWKRKHHNLWQQVDAENLMGWLLGGDDDEGKKTFACCAMPLAAHDGLSAAALAVAGKDNLWTRRKMNRAAKWEPGGNFYPPIHAFWYAPVALMAPPLAYRVTMCTMLAVCLVAGLGLYKLSAGAIWWPVGTLLVVVFPGVYSAQSLGHSSIVILALLIWGYYYLQKNADIKGGILWGLIAYKPTWAVVYFVGLLIARRWRAALAMGLCGVAQILLTLPFVGVQCWQDWYEVSRDGAKWYNKSAAWINCARDLNAIPRRHGLLVDWSEEGNPKPQPERFEVAIVTFLLIATFFEATVRLTTLRTRGRKRWSPAGAAFLLTGIWMCCWRITYYDTMFVALPVALLCCTPSMVNQPFFWRKLRRQWKWGDRVLALPARNFGWICNPLVVGLLPFMVAEPGWFNVPWVVPFFALTWLWAGWLWLRTPDPGEPEFPAASQRVHEASASPPPPRRSPHITVLGDEAAGVPV
jgi:hypothetical protein